MNKAKYKNIIYISHKENKQGITIFPAFFCHIFYFTDNSDNQSENYLFKKGTKSNNDTPITSSSKKVYSKVTEEKEKPIELLTPKVIKTKQTVIKSKVIEAITKDNDNIKKVQEEKKQKKEEKIKQRVSKPKKEIKEPNQNIAITYIKNLRDITYDNIKLCNEIEDNLKEIEHDLGKIDESDDITYQEEKLDDILDDIDILKEKCNTLINDFGLDINIKDYKQIKDKKESVSEKETNTIAYLKYIEELHSNLNEELIYRKELLNDKKLELSELKSDKEKIIYLSNQVDMIINYQKQIINNKEIGKIKEIERRKYSLVLNLNNLIMGPLLFNYITNHFDDLANTPVSFGFTLLGLGISFSNILKTLSLKEASYKKYLFKDYEHKIKKGLFDIKDSNYILNSNKKDVKEIIKKLESKEYQDLKDDKQLKDLLEKLKIIDKGLDQKKEKLTSFEKQLNEKLKVNEKAKKQHKKMVRTK